MIESAGRSLLVIVLLTFGLLAGSLFAGQEPLLGLDLQGGVEVVLEPLDNPENLALATPENLDTAVEILRKRVDAIGVAEPDITTQTGDKNFIIVQLPGIENQDDAVELVGATAELQFRPVLFDPLGPQNESGDPIVPPFDELDLNGGPGMVEMLEGVLSDPRTTPADQSAIFIDALRGVPVLLGPTEFTGTALSGAEAQSINGAWRVEVTFKEGPEGLGEFNKAAASCFAQELKCPFGRLAFVLDGAIESAPSIRAPQFTEREVYITRDQGFPEVEAKDTALVLDFGALPIAFADPADPSAGLVRTVSATLGRDSLDAGLIAGLIGLLLVAAYMLWYYRMLGLAAMLSLCVSGTLLWIVVSWLSSTQGLALTLAGVVGLIVSIGVSLDSNVIFFEDLKDISRRGANELSTAVNRAFPQAFSTVFWANMATLIGAIILYLLTVGSVRGFALMLGIASILDLVATYFFMAPLIKLLTERFGSNPKMFGVREQRGEGISGTSTVADAAVEVAT